MQPNLPPRIKDKKYHWFCGLGGSGSTALIGNLQQYANYIIVRPDLCVTPTDFMPKNDIGGQRVAPSSGLKAPLLNLKALQVFKDRTGGFPVETTITIEELFLSLGSFVQQTGGAVFSCFLCDFEFFSRNKAPNVVFLFRHPLHAYASWIKPTRHKTFADSHGGVTATLPATIYATWWLRQAQEYRRLKDLNLNPVLIRFESVKNDTPTDLSGIFTDWDESKRNSGALTTSVSNTIIGTTAPELDKLYPQSI